VGDEFRSGNLTMGKKMKKLFLAKNYTCGGDGIV